MKESVHVWKREDGAELHWPHEREEEEVRSWQEVEDGGRKVEEKSRSCDGPSVEVVHRNRLFCQVEANHIHHGEAVSNVLRCVGEEDYVPGPHGEVEKVVLLSEQVLQAERVWRLSWRTSPPQPLRPVVLHSIRPMPVVPPPVSHTRHLRSPC